MVRGILLSAMVAASDAPIDDKATVEKAVKVQSALAMDGRNLPAGWWLSDERIVKVGEKLQQCGEAPIVIAEKKGVEPWQVIALLVASGAIIGTTVAVFSTPPPKVEK